MTRKRLFTLLGLTLFGALASAQTGTAGSSAGAPTPGRILEAVDTSLRWVRTEQGADGSYGGVSETSAALLAFATSHRAYRRTDGPFVERALSWLEKRQAADGSVSDLGAGEEQRNSQTELALHAFDACGSLSHAKSAAAFLGIEAVWQELLQRGDGRLEALPTHALQDMAAERLAELEGILAGDPEVGRVAQQIRSLASLARVLKQRDVEESSAVDKQARALPAFDPADAQAGHAAMERGARFLLEAAVGPGRWGYDGQANLGITAMVTGSLLALPEPRPEAVQAAIEKALDWLVANQRPDGSIQEGQLANYVTSASILALAAADRERDRAVIARAREFLRGLQADEGEGYGSSDRYYGGVGYGGDERPDLSNLQMALEALAAAGLEENDEAFQKAVLFLQRCQNRSESNDLSIVQDGDVIVSGNDGGAAYAPGESKAGTIELAGGKRVPRSYGSMTYALLKGYLLAGLAKEDPRVQAAWEWLCSHYTLDVNPGFEASSDPTAAYQGLFYYFLAMSRALDLYGEDVITDGLDRPHAWRSELSGRLIAMQQRDGSWVNENASRWYEGNPVLATAYALLTLGTALPE